MTSPRPPAGGAGVRELVSGQLDWAHDTADASPSVAQFVTHLHVPSLAAALNHLDAAGGGRTLDSTAAPPVVTVNGPDLGELDGRGTVRRRLVVLTGPAQRRLRVRVEQAARMQRLALASARSRSARSASRGVRNAAS